MNAEHLAAGIQDYLAMRYFKGNQILAELATQRAYERLKSVTITDHHQVRPWLYHTATVCAVELLKAA
ncbi:hypothetical protein [Anatilimnocola floriformis]|uniref:hypothetical protein n=1 Tax=Anatilimnocola floriformis TaxID=2948575 RepID=UPI0020C30627|nr:hypothetical protein [Anatilimnocola floriformis]